MNKFVTTNLIFEEYEKRFAKARLEHPFREMWTEKDRQDALNQVKAILRFNESLIPEIKILDEKGSFYDNIKVTHYTFESWKNFYGKFTLFSPNKEGKCPLILVCAGHNEEGCLAASIQNLAFHLANMGCYVLINQNIGQGSRAFLGHNRVNGPFYCGLTLQGLIVAETIAVLQFAKKFDFVDQTRIGATGNSGGGTLTLFLSALAKDIKAVASTGYPSAFSYILQKERRHCSCNILHHYEGKIDMWEVLSLHAPNPLMIEQGINDHLIPLDHFYRAGRKVKTVYTMMNAADNFTYKTTETGHGWQDSDRIVIGDFFAQHFELENKDIQESKQYLIPLEEGEINFPSNAITTDELATQLTGIKVPENIQLEDIFVPTYQGKPIAKEDIVEDLGRGSIMRVWAQYEASL